MGLVIDPVLPGADAPRRAKPCRMDPNLRHFRRGPDLEPDLDQWPVGGLGRNRLLWLLKRFADEATQTPSALLLGDRDAKSDSDAWISKSS